MCSDFARDGELDDQMENAGGCIDVRASGDRVVVGLTAGEDGWWQLRCACEGMVGALPGDYKKQAEDVLSSACYFCMG